MSSVPISCRRPSQVAFLALGLATFAACSSSTTEPAAAPSMELDRAALRERIRTELGERYDEPVPLATFEQLEHGAEIWKLLCAGCHGNDGRGGGTAARRLALKPLDLTDPEVDGFFSDQARLQIIRKGIQGTPMIGWDDALGEDDLQALFGHMQALTLRSSESP